MSGKVQAKAGALTPTRLAQYKTNGHDWKETYRKRCLTRLRERRTELFAKRRDLGKGDGAGEEDSGKLIKMVMSTELLSLKGEGRMEDIDMDFFDPATGEIDTTLALIEEIQEEMKAEEARLLAEYEIYQASLQKEEAALCSAIEMLNTGPTCPVCMKNSLMQNKGVIFCKCGMRIYTEQDQMSLDFVQGQLEDARSQHDCDGQPRFSVENLYGITNLLMTCQKCDFFYIVI